MLSPSTNRDFWKGEHLKEASPHRDVTLEPSAHTSFYPRGARRPRGIVVVFAYVDVCVWMRLPVHRDHFEGGSHGSCFDRPSLRPTRECAVAGL